MIRNFVWVLGLGLWATAAQAETAEYDVTLQGLKVAELVITGNVGDGSYAVQLMIRSEGLAGVVKRVRFRADVQGKMDGGFQPARYVEKADTGRRQSDVEIVYDGGVPQVLRYVSPREDGPERLDPAAQTGALDPATALYSGLRDRPVGQGCAMDFPVFDGRRRSAFSLSGDGVTCSGSFRRIAGYTPQEMAERTRFPIEITYAPEERVMRVIAASVQTVYGKVRLKRR